MCMRLGHGALAAESCEKKEDKMTERTMPAGYVDIRKEADELGEVLGGLRAGRIWFDENAGEFLAYPEEGGREPGQEGVELADLGDWLNQQLDLTVWYKRKQGHGQARPGRVGRIVPEFEVAGFEVLITCGGPTVRLSYMGGELVLYHSWGWKNDKAIVWDKDRRNSNTAEGLGEWILETLQEWEG